MIEYAKRYKRPEFAEPRQDEIVATITIHELPQTIDTQAFETELTRAVARLVGIEMTPDGQAGVGFMAPQVYVGVRAV